MSKRLLSAILLALAFLGLADAWYLTQSAFTDTALVCNLGSVLDGCNIVAQSEYSRFLGIPLALYGVVLYAFIFVLAALLMVSHVRIIYRALMVLGLVGAIFSLVFLFIQFALIKAICIYCIGSAVIALLIWLVTYRLWKRHAPPRLAVVA